jgi:hypothetical protein
MQREAPDSIFFREINDFNAEFLALLAAAATRYSGPMLGLDSAILEPIAKLSGAQLEAIAGTPCLLAGFAVARRQRALRVAESQPSTDAAWTEQARLFAAGLLTYAWQMARRDPLRAALCLGPQAQALVAGTTLRDIRSSAERNLQHLEARFASHSRFWPDLVRAARDGRPERIQLARLTAIQLATLEARRSNARERVTTLATGAASTR